MMHGFPTDSDRDRAARANNGESSLAAQVEHLRNLIGKAEMQSGTICPAPVANLAATLDRSSAPHLGDPLPPLWHWLFFHPASRQSDLGQDGHSARGHLLPPMPLPRRMWAGGRLRFLRPLQIGESAARTSTIRAIKLKQGSSGPLLFVTLGHEIRNAGGALSISEEQDFVFREYAPPASRAAKSYPAPEDPEWGHEIVPSSTMLFRYSALTFNSHRIHYDRPYATDVEGYSGLVVHGPLLATLLAELLQKSLPEAGIGSFTYRAISPLFDIDRIVLCGRNNSANEEVSLWAQTREGRLAMSATAKLISVKEPAHHA